MTTGDLHEALDNMVAVLLAENTALRAAHLDEVALLLPRKRKAAEAIHTATTHMAMVPPSQRETLSTQARRLATMITTNGDLLTEALSTQRRVIELLVRKDIPSPGTNIYGRYGQHCEERNAGPSARWKITTA